GWWWPTSSGSGRSWSATRSRRNDWSGRPGCPPGDRPRGEQALDGEGAPQFVTAVHRRRGRYRPPPATIAARISQQSAGVYGRRQTSSKIDNSFGDTDPQP